MKNSRILVSISCVCLLYTCAFGSIGLHWQSDYVDFFSWRECSNCSNEILNAGVYVKDGNVNGADVFIDDERKYIFGGFSGNGNVLNNKVENTGNVGDSIIAGYTLNGNATQNSIIMRSGKVGFLEAGHTEKGDAINNSIVVFSGQIHRINGTGSTENGNAINNILKVYDGVISTDIFGAYSKNGNVKNNVVVIYGGLVDTYYYDSGNVYTSRADNGDVIDNVLLYAGGKIKGKIEGGYTRTGKSLGNQLIIANKNLTARAVSSFQEYLFALPIDIKANDVMLTLNEKLTFNANDKINITTLGYLPNLQIGNKVILIKNIDAFNQSMFDKALKAKYNEIFLDYMTIQYSYSFELEQEGSNLNAILVDKTSSVNQEAKSLSEGSSASMATLNSASDTIAGKATESAVANANANGGADIGNFGAIGAGANRYETGSYVDSKSINLVAGVALGKELNYGKLVVGPFIEFGYSDYETHNDFSSGHVKGDGDSKYYGIGALTRFDFNDFKGSRPYLEFSARFGRNNNDFNNDLGASYDVSSNYYGLHAGLGYIIASGANSFDIYGKYFFTHLNSADTTLATGENFAFDAVKSHKTRLGVKYSREIELSNGAKIAPYIGAGWEKEYSGDAKATTTPAGSNIGFAVTAPSLKGNSAMAEIGVNIGKDKGFKADIGLTGYAGIHRGVNANLMLQYEF